MTSRSNVSGEAPAGGSLPVGSRLGAWVVIRFLARGGMGEVFEVENTISKARRALKVVRADRLDEEARGRFVREVTIAAHLKHPNVVESWDPILEGGLIALPMELLEGETLADRLRRGPFDPLEAVDLVTTVANAIGAFHAQGVIHRDIKPGNIFLQRTAHGVIPKVLDFGAAREVSGETHTLTGHVVGSPAYMAPEQAMGIRDLDARVDVYALGVILYALLSGRRPYESDEHGTALAKVIQRRAYAPLQSLRRSLPDSLCGVVDGALMWNRDERIPSMAAFARALHVERTRVTTDDRASLTSHGPSVASDERTGALRTPHAEILAPVGPPLSASAAPTLHEPSSHSVRLPVRRMGPVLVVLAVLVLFSAAGVAMVMQSQRTVMSPPVPATSPMAARDAGVDAPDAPEPPDAGTTEDVGRPARRHRDEPRREERRDGLWLDPKG